MRIAFYAPLKPPDHPIASGDRAMARALIAALELGDHDVTIASRFRSRDGGDPARQERLKRIGERLAGRYLHRIESGRAAAPDLWLTYHLYHRAPDWLGPRVTAKLRIPYVVAEASYAPKQAGGPWDLGLKASAEAIAQADLVLEPNPADAECVLPLLAAPERLALLPPFLDTAPLREPQRDEARAQIGSALDLAADRPWLLAVGMMREDQKRLSYGVLADALSNVQVREWSLIIAGGGPAEPAVRRDFAPFGDKVRFTGAVDFGTLKLLYRAADLYVWPAIKEAWGMALLEAQSAGLPTVAGRSGGVAAIVADGETGMLVPEGDALAFAKAVSALLAAPGRRQEMGRAAQERAKSRHDIASAAAFLDSKFRALLR